MGKVFLTVFALNSDFQTAGLGIAEIWAASDLEIFLLARRPRLNVHGLDLQIRQVAAATFQRANRDIQRAEEIKKIEFVLELFKLFSIKYSSKAIVKALWNSIKLIRKTSFLEEYLSSISAYIKNYATIKSLNELFDSFTAKINRQKRLSGNLTFKDVSELSLEILINHKEYFKK